MEDLFGAQGQEPDEPTASAPLAERMRPGSVSEVVGQDRILGPSTPLAAAIAQGRLPSLILWGPPGCGKTTLAACLAREIEAMFLPYSAVRVGVKELKAVMADAARMRKTGSRPPVLFLDEIHRFNKAQQDALLPSVEKGDVVLIGATTENPSFEVNAALLSRCRLVVLEPIGIEDLIRLLERALGSDRGLGPGAPETTGEALRRIAERSGGDARFALGALELCATAARRESRPIDPPLVDEVLATTHLVYDKSGEEHFNLISALHKSLRNSDVQATVYWLARMLEAGEDPMYVARRMVRFASEDIGLADPNALVQANAGADAMHRLGMPEGALALAQAAVYLAQSPKSNSLYRAWGEVTRAIRDGARHPVPHHLRNAPTRTMAELGYGRDYDYAHDHEEGVAPMRCLPDEIANAVFYRPTSRGFESEAAERLRHAWRRARGDQRD
jgi:putative ATPase